MPPPPAGWERSRNHRRFDRWEVSPETGGATARSRARSHRWARLHKKVDTEFDYDPSAGRFTPKNPLGAAGETLDALHAAKEEAEKSGLYKKMQSGNPDDLFDAAEEYGKVFTKLADGALAPKRILPTYKMLVDSAKPPLPARREGPRPRRRRSREGLGCPPRSGHSTR